MTSHLPKQLRIRDCLLFPVRSSEGRRDIFLGGLVVIFLLPIGWILNLGARLDVVHRLYVGDAPYFRGMRPWTHTFKRGCISATTIFCYLLPANLCFFAATIAGNSGSPPLTILCLVFGFTLFLLGVFTLPGCMTVYACEEEPRVLRNPTKAFLRAYQHRRLYLKAWGIALLAVLLSFLGLLFFVVGFFFTSVWAWEVVGYAFTIAMYTEPRERAS